MSRTVRVLMTKKFFDEDLDYIRAGLADGVELVAPPEYTVEAIAEAVKAGHDVLLGDLLAPEVLDNAAASVKVIQVPWTGVDRLDFQLLRRYSFTVCNSHSNATVVAEMGVALLMAVVKQVPFHDRHLREGRWWRPKRDAPDSFFPPDLISGKTIGFIGFGAVGRKISQLLSGFSVEFIAVDARDCAGAPEPLSRIVKPDRMDDVVADADVLFLTVPLTEATRGLIDKSVFEKMKPTAYLVNICRGAIVVEEDLYEALKSRRIAGAAVDTWYNYPSADEPNARPSRKCPFEELDNLVLSPHRAGFVRGGHPHLDDAVENINRLASGRELINVVDLQGGY